MGWHDEDYNPEFLEDYKNNKQKVECTNCGWSGQFCEMGMIYYQFYCPACQEDTWQYVKDDEKSEENSDLSNKGNRIKKRRAKKIVKIVLGNQVIGQNTFGPKSAIDVSDWLDEIMNMSFEKRNRVLTALHKPRIYEHEGEENNEGKVGITIMINDKGVQFMEKELYKSAAKELAEFLNEVLQMDSKQRNQVYKKIIRGW